MNSPLPPRKRKFNRYDKTKNDRAVKRPCTGQKEAEEKNQNN